MLKYFCILIAGLYVIPSFGGATLQDCEVNFYNAPGLISYQNGVPVVSSYTCKPCSNVHIGNVYFSSSVGGKITKDECYTRTACSDLGYDGWMCTLFYSGKSFCTQANTPRPAHLEYQGNTLVCVSNDDRACSGFNLSDNYIFDVANGSFVQSDQTGNASWNPETYTWNVSSCRLEKNNQNITANNANCKGNIWRCCPSISGNAAEGFSIGYGYAHYYCTYCREGLKPYILNKAENPMLPMTHISDETGGTHIAGACSAVEAGYYSTGCSITYPLNSANIPENCHLQCPENMTTLDPGADSINSCVPYGGTYCDQTGCFTFGTDASVCP